LAQLTGACTQPPKLVPGAGPPSSETRQALPALDVAKPVASAPSFRGAVDGPAAHRLAVAVVGEQLCVIDAETGRTRPLAALAPTWCEYDPGNEGTWALVWAPDALRLVFVTGAGSVHDIVRFVGALTVPSWVRLWINDAVMFGQLYPMSSQPELDVNLSAMTTSAVNHCHGDAVWYCYQDSSLPVEQWPLQPQFAAAMQAFGAGVFTDAPLLSRLRERARSARIVPRTPLPERLPLACGEFSCGQAIALPPSDVLLVHTSMSFGDFTHFNQQLFDPHTREYFLPGKASQRSKAPLPEDTWEPRSLYISPDGKYLMQEGELSSLDADRRIEIGAACGWLGEGSLLRAAFGTD
jgi:hypothetical protein